MTWRVKNPHLEGIGRSCLGAGVLCSSKLSSSHSSMDSVEVARWFCQLMRTNTITSNLITLITNLLLLCIVSKIMVRLMRAELSKT